MKYLAIPFLAMFLFACGGGAEQDSHDAAPAKDDAEAAAPAEPEKEASNVPSGDDHTIYLGDWTLASIEGKEGPVELTECDLQTVWTFTDDEAEPLGDGTATMRIVASAPDECEFYGFESKWTAIQGIVFISSTNFGGTGGQSHAGRFKPIEVTDSGMKLEILGHTYTFTR